MTKKLKELTQEEIHKIHVKYRSDCHNCPLARYEKKNEEEHELFCYAWFTKNLLNNEDLLEQEIEIKEGDIN